MIDNHLKSWEGSALKIIIYKEQLNFSWEHVMLKKLPELKLSLIFLLFMIIDIQV